MISEPVLCRAFIGRQAELDHLMVRRRAAAAGRGGAVLIAGEAGFGKSRLIAEFRRTLPRRATRVASAACRPFAQRPLGPWLDVLAALDPAAAATLATSAFASKDDRMAALIDTFGRLAARATTVVFLEDLHWGDPDIAQLLLVLTERAATQRLLFVGTYRDDELRAGHPAFPILGRLLRERATSLVKLPAFDEREMTQLLREASPAQPILPDAVFRDVRRRADGNALFGEELLRHAVDRCRYGADAFAGPLPISLEAIIRERLTVCDDADRDLLMRASLFGRTFDIAVLADVAGTTPERCRPALERLATLQLIDSTDAAASEYRFRHALTRDVIYREIPDEARPRLHRRVAEAITLRGTSGAHAEALAHNYWLAGEPARAAPFALAAGDAARALHAYEDAATWYERAADGFEGDVAAAAALVSAGLMHVFRNDLERALALYHRAGETYERAGRVDDAIVARVMAAGPLHNGGRGAEAIALLQDTKRRLGAHASREHRERLVVRLGFLFAFARRTDEAWAAANEIGDETLGAVSALAAEAHFLRAAVHAQQAEPERWRTHAERGLDLFERIGALPDNVRAALGNAAVQALALGESGAAHAYQTRAVALARQLNSEADYESAVLAEIELALGRLDAVRALTAAPLTAPTFNARAQRVLVTLALATLRGAGGAGSGGAEAGDALIDVELIDEAERGGHGATAIKLATTYAAFLAGRGRGAEAAPLLERALAALATAYDMTHPIVTLARLRPERLAPVRPLVERAAARPQDRVARALLAFVDAARARARGDEPAAREAGAAAARRYAELGWPLLAAHARELAGDEAAARAAYRSLGAHADLRRLERALASDRALTRSQTSLTPRERELARIVAQGKSNRAAARVLSVSEKAVEKHLTSIYAKLGMTSRAQLAAYVASGRSE